MKVDSEGVVKIFDFGLARDTGVGASTVGFVGTTGFAAPELYTHHSSFTVSVDTYAFGATALFLGLRHLPAELMLEPPSPPLCDYFVGFSFPVANELKSILNSCLDRDPVRRPAMSDVRDALAKHLLFDRHRALVVFEGKASYLNSKTRSVRLSLAAMGDIEISYDGFSFQVTSVAGDVFVNSRRVVVGDNLPGACVVTLGAPEYENRRKYITFDLSHPEIVL